MEEEKVVKKNNKPLLVIALAFILIIAGIALEVSGNNILFGSKKGNNANNANNEENTEIPDPNGGNGGEEDPKRGTIVTTITEEEVRQLIDAKKASEFGEETWSVGVVTILAHDEKYEKYLVSYEEIQEDATIVIKQTIVNVINDDMTIELPGWEDGSRDLTVYGFIYGEDEPVEIDEPTEPVAPTEPTEPTEPVEQDGGIEISVPIDDAQVVPAVEPVE